MNDRERNFKRYMKKAIEELKKAGYENPELAAITVINQGILFGLVDEDYFLTDEATELLKDSNDEPDSENH